MADFLSDWRRLPGTKRRYVNTKTGADLSDRQFRQYRRFFEAERHLEVAALAKQQLKQKKYNDLVNSYVENEYREIEQEKENDNYLFMTGKIDEKENKRRFKELDKRQRTAKSRARTSPEFKRAVADLKKYSGASKEDNEKRAMALKVLGRRTGIPDWGA